MGKMIEKEKKAKSQTGLRIEKGARSLLREASADDPIYTRGFAIGIIRSIPFAANSAAKKLPQK